MKQNKGEEQAARNEYLKKVLGAEGESLIAQRGPKKDTRTEEQKAKDKEDQAKLFSLELEKLSNLAAEQSNSIQVTKDCNKLLDDARTLLKEENPNVSAVLAKFNLVKQRLIQAFDSRELYGTKFGWLLGYNIFLFLGMAVTIGVFHLIPGQSHLHNTAWVILACALFGGLGGVADAFWSMHTHFSKQDFDTRYQLWYYLHPVLGLSFGAVIYLVLQAGLMSINGASLTEASGNVTGSSQAAAISANVTSMLSNPETAGKVGAVALPIVMAFLAGFRQNAIVNFFNRLVTAFFPKTSSDGTE